MEITYNDAVAYIKKWKANGGEFGSRVNYDKFYDWLRSKGLDKLEAGYVKSVAKSRLW